MALTLSNLKLNSGFQRSGKRLGRGSSSGRGASSGRGTKGQSSRSGGAKGLLKKALRLKLMKYPKYKGFKSTKEYLEVVNLDEIAKVAFPAKTRITAKLLSRKGVIGDTTSPVKILGYGELKTPLVFSKEFIFSAPAIEKINAAGGSIEK